MKNRLNIDWSKHKIIITKNDFVSIYSLKIPDSSYHSCKFINSCGILAVTGDFGNWIFCREFHPYQYGVSDGYWKEKLKISSCQEPSRYDPERTEQDIKNAIADEDNDKEYKDYLEDILNYVDNEIEYQYHAYNNLPSRYDYESIIFVKTVSNQLLAVFDAFDEICRRITEHNNDKNESS